QREARMTSRIRGNRAGPFAREGPARPPRQHDRTRSVARRWALVKRRVVVTGMGAVTPLGRGVDAFWEGVVHGRSGVGPITQFDASAFSTRIAAEVKDFDPTDFMDKKDARRMDRFAQFAVAGARMALEEIGRASGRERGYY